jgi:hypothetical protein
VSKFAFVENLQFDEALARVRPNVGTRSRIEIPQRTETTIYREMDIGLLAEHGGCS